MTSLCTTVIRLGRRLCAWFNRRHPVRLPVKCALRPYGDGDPIAHPSVTWLVSPDADLRTILHAWWILQQKHLDISFRLPSPPLIRLMNQCELHISPHQQEDAHLMIKTLRLSHVVFHTLDTWEAMCRSADIITSTQSETIQRALLSHIPVVCTQAIRLPVLQGQDATLTCEVTDPAPLPAWVKGEPRALSLYIPNIPISPVTWEHGRCGIWCGLAPENYIDGLCVALSACAKNKKEL